MAMTDYSALIEEADYYLASWDGDYVQRGTDMIRRLSAALSSLSSLAETEAEWEYGWASPSGEPGLALTKEEAEWHATNLEPHGFYRVSRRRKAGPWEVTQ